MTLRVGQLGLAFTMGVRLCSGCSSPAPTDTLAGTWLATVAQDPATFTAVVDAAVDAGGSRAAWIALHQNNWLAIPTGSSVPSLRADAELQQLNSILARANTEAVLTLAQGWSSRSPDVPVPAWLAASAQRLAGRFTEPDANNSAPPEASLHASSFAVDSLGTRDPNAMRATYTTPQVDPTLGTFWDPTRPLALKRAYAARAKPAAAGLAGALFGPVDISGAAPATDDIGACRTFGQAFNTTLDAGAAALATNAPAEGRALLHDLGLVEVARSRTLTRLAVNALEAKHPTCAVWYAEQALDHAAARRITPTNSPTVYAVIAAANIQLGHVREALDALNVLRPNGSEGYPEALGVIEAVSDLAVQQGMDRHGASGEN